MKGLLVYNKDDYLRNVEYVNWLLDEAGDYNFQLDLILKEDFDLYGVSNFLDYSFVINRTRSYELSLIFELNDIRVFNNSAITLLGNNKLAAYKYAKDKSYLYPKVKLSWSDTNKTISKPNSGHGGEGIGLVEDVDLKDGNIRLQQELIGDLIGDIRFYIINNKIIQAVLRKAKDKIVSNFTMGGEIEYYKYTNIEKDYVERFVEGLQIDYAGVDFLLTKDNKLIFNEIEDVVGSRMLSQLGINNTTELYFQHINNEMKQ